MPYPNGMLPRLELLAMGITPITASIAALIAAPALLVAHRHWRKMQQPGHFDTLDDECAALLHIDPENLADTRAHLDEWNPALKERFRKMFVRSIKSRRPFVLAWDRTSGDEAELEVFGDEDGIVHTVTVLQPRRTVPAELR